VSRSRALIQYLFGHPFIRFGMVGGVGFVVDTSIFLFDTGALGLPVWLGRAVSIAFGMCCTYLGNRYLTFAETRAHGLPAVLREWLTFVAANSVGAFINYGVSLLAIYLMPPPLNNKIVGLVCGVLVGMVFNFTMSKRLVFTGTDRHSDRQSQI
jgi:putative flippase GtrA